MSRFSLVLVALSCSLIAAPYWIQVSSIKESRTVSPLLLKKIEKSGFNYTVVENEGRKRVRLGGFSHYKEAQEALPKVRCKIAYDAFIVAKNPIRKKAVVTVKKVESEHHKTAVTANVPKTPQVTKKAPQPCDCMYDVHGLRKSEIDRALHYYKAADYYEFGSK